MPIRIIKDKISRKELDQIAREIFGELTKAVVDIDKRIMAIGGELHSDEESVLLEQGSLQEHLWGINLYPNETEDKMIEFDSVINIRPSLGNRSRGVENPEIKEKIIHIIKSLVE